jgi:hypothetical protein
MTRLRAICTAVALVCASGQVFADTASHNASAEAFLTLAHADKLGTPVYMQVQQMFAQRFEQTKAPAAKQSVLDSYQAKANAALDQAIGWPKLKPDMVKLYTTNFSESELKDLVAFYQAATDPAIGPDDPGQTGKRRAGGEQAVGRHDQRAVAQSRRTGQEEVSSNDHATAYRNGTRRPEPATLECVG